MSKIIRLTKGYITIVDNEDYPLLNNYNWCVNVKKTSVGKINPYAMRAYEKNGKNIKIYMHNAIMNPKNGLTVDHINGIPLDNRRCNLRICTHRQNTFNCAKRHRNKNKYKGVYYRKDVDRYRVRITIRGKLKDFGYYDDPDEAARVYNEVVKKYRGEYAYLNKIHS